VEALFSLTIVPDFTESSINEIESFRVIENLLSDKYKLRSDS